MYAPSYVWAKVLMHLQQQLTEVTVSAWLEDAQVIDLTEDTLVVYSPSEFRQQMIRETCGPHIQEALRQLLQREIQLQVLDDEELSAYREEKWEDPVYSNPQFTFESYISGSSNQLAAKVARAAAEKPGQELYNPLFLYGPPGVGKTHLLYAIANAVMAAYPEKRVVCIRADQFTNELISGIRDGTMDAFKRKYRRADVLLIDDIQFIAGKDATQEEFFHTFNDLFSHKKQIVIAADRRPADMATLEDRLKGRFGSGILVGIDPPDYETRVQIIRTKACRYELRLNEESITHIATVLTDNVRQIEGALKKLRAVHALTGEQLTTDAVKRILETLSGEETAAHITAEQIIGKVCRYYGVDEATLKGPTRGKSVTEPRQVAMYLVRRMLGISFEEMGRLFCRDHGTVIYSVKKMTSALEKKNTRLERIIGEITAGMAEPEA